MMDNTIAIIDHVGIKAGMEEYDLGLLNCFRNMGVPATVFSNFTSAGDQHVVPFFKFQNGQNALDLLKLAYRYFKLSHHLKNSRTIHCILHGFKFGMLEWVFMRTIKARKRQIYLIVHDLESLVDGGNEPYWRHKIFNECKVLVVHNRYCFDILYKELSVQNRSKLNVVPHGNFVPGIDDERYAKNAAPLNYIRKKQLLFFGQIKASKGLDLLLESMNSVDSSVMLVIAGKMRHHSFNGYEALISKYNLQDRVKLQIGYISPETREELFQSADAVVLPYRKVFQSGVLLKAMSEGKAVIASDLQPNEEIITNNVNGFLFTAGDKKSLADTINKVMSDDDKRNEVGVKGLEFVREKHDWNKIAAMWIKLFER